MSILCYKKGCRNICNKNNDFCSNHIPNQCITYNCDEFSVHYGKHCNVHTCTKTRCTQERKSNKNYCTTHDPYKCCTRTCTNPCDDNSEFCSHHIPYQCMTHNCDKFSVHYGDYCKDHTCRNNKCALEIDKFSSTYCCGHQDIENIRVHFSF
jgi:hypothetical protein